MSRPVMIFAAGFGTRMGALTRTRPKPLIPVAGRPLIDHTLDLAAAMTPPRIVANAHYMAGALAAHLEPLGITVARESPDILDTGGGLKAALPLLDAETVFTTNSDAIWSGPNPLSLLDAAWEPEHMDALVVCVPLAQAVGRKERGDFVLDADGRIARGGTHVYGGVQIIRTACVADWPEQVFSLNAIWDSLHASGRLYGLSYPGRWCDVGHPEGIALAEDLIRSRDV